MLAFGFASPWLLSGLVLASIPVVIHLLHKRNYKETYWAAMKFLFEAARKNSRRLRLQQLILLAVRILIFVFLVLTLARPYVESAGTFFRAEVPTHRIIVVDTSFSMGHQPAAAGRFSLLERAQEAAQQIVAQSKSGDALNLVRISEMHPRVIIRQPAYQKKTVIEEIDELQVSDERGDVLATLGELVKLLDEVPEIPQKEISLISDFQRNSWSPTSSGRKAQIRKLLKRISQRAKLVFVDVQQAGTENAAVTRFETDEPFVSIERSIGLRVSVRNFGQTALSDQLLELHIDGLLAETERFDLPAGDEQQLDFTFKFSSSGEHRLEARLQGDALPIDNHRWLSVPVHENLKVLLVNGTHAGREQDTAPYYVHRALSPSTADRPSIGFIQVNLINEGELSSVALSRYDCVFLCNVGVLTERESEILHTYVKSGGGLIITLGPQVQVDNYNLRLFQDGEGLLPAKLGDRMGSLDKEYVFYFDSNDLDHPIVKEFEGNPGAGLETTMTFQYVKAAIPEDSRVRVALRFQSNDPAIIEKRFGRGRSILITTAVDVEWGTWAISPCFLPLMHETVLHAVAGRSSERQLTVAEPLSRVLSTRAYGIPVILKTPNGDQKPMQLIEDDDFMTILFEETARSGIYELKLGQPPNRTELYAVNVDSVESDLRKLSKEDLDTELLQGIDSVYRTLWQEVDQKTNAAVAEKGGLTRWLLCGTICLLLVEQMMAWRFFYGFLLLYAVVAFALVRQTMAGNLFWGLTLLIALVAGFVAIILAARQNLADRYNA